MQSRFRSRTAWASIFSLILLVLKLYYKFDVAEYDKLATAILACGTTLGIFNNPTDKENY